MTVPLTVGAAAFLEAPSCPQAFMVGCAGSGRGEGGGWWWVRRWGAERLLSRAFTLRRRVLAFFQPQRLKDSCLAPSPLRDVLLRTVGSLPAEIRTNLLLNAK